MSIKKTFLFITCLLLLLTGCSFKETVGKLTNKETSSSQDGTTENNEANTLEAPNKLLQLNNKSESVIQLKKALQHIGYDVTEGDQFDEETKQQIKDFQSQIDDLPTTGKYDRETFKWLELVLTGSPVIEPGNGFSSKNITTSTNKSITVGNPNSILVLVNKHHALPNGYEPKDLIIPDVPFPFTEESPKKQMRKEAAHALEDLFELAKKDKLKLYGQSGYRSYDRQVAVFSQNAKSMGEKKANQISARPGESEHQTGLTIDVSAKSVDYRIDEDFGESKEGQWLKDHAHEAGFIIRYPKGKEDITGYSYEPWHIRYVGKDVATVIHNKSITLEQYLGAVEE